MMKLFPFGIFSRRRKDETVPDHKERLRKERKNPPDSDSLMEGLQNFQKELENDDSSNDRSP